MGIIYLLTDFGDSDPYVAILKSRILNINAKAKIVDLSHNLKQFDIEFTSWFLLYSFLNLENDAIITCIVDPGVGTTRKPLIVKMQKRYYILPDNGLITLVLRECQKKGIFYQFYQIQEQLLLRLLKKIYASFGIVPQLSNTFHGRDLFAPVAAILSKNDKILTKIAKRIEIIEGRNFSYSIEIDLETFEDSSITGKIVYIDHFGNLFTNLRIQNPYKKPLTLYIKKGRLTLLKIIGISKTFQDVKKNDFLFYVGSFGFIEIARNQNSASKYFGDYTTIKILQILLEISK